MHRFAILVDAGYFMRQAVEIMSNKMSSRRNDLALTDPKGLLQMLVEKAADCLQNQSLLRVYWYDGIGSQMTAEHKAIIALADVQIRAGTINAKGQQKGVDSLIVTDLVELATHHAICDAMLVTGDGDLAIGIELAQRRGVRVAIMGVEEPAMRVWHHQSPELSHIADRVIRIGKTNLQPYLAYAPALANAPAKTLVGASTTAIPTLPPEAKLPNQLAASMAGKIEQAVDEFMARSAPLPTTTIVTVTGNIEPQFDRGLLYAVMSHLGEGALTAQQKNYARAYLKKRLAG